jgi:hypothetical protein
MSQTATILISDISGYTEFLTKTELVHSSHIINELLETILAANSSEFVLSEVEGDALLLYRKGGPIEPDELVRLCTGMFESFHKQLKIIERDSICQCGACRTMSNLSLKFIAHFGAIHEIKVSQFTKCSGIDMVVAHRLLKNRVLSHEYILATRTCFDCTSLEHSPGALAWQQESDQYPAIGNIDYQYASLEELKKTIADLPPRVSPVIEHGDDSVSIEIDAPMLKIYQLIIDLDRRLSWVTGQDAIDIPAMTERIGMRRVCTLRGMPIEWTAVKSDLGRSAITYVEQGKVLESGMPLQGSFIFKRLGERKTSVHFHPKWLCSPEPPREVTAGMLADMKSSLETAKMICEEAK